MEIRFAGTQDVPGILSLLRQAGAICHRDRPDLFRPGGQKYGASQVLGMLDKSATPVFVAAEDEKILGCAVCRIKTYENDPMIVDRTELHIDELCVEETVRDEHIGAAFYEEICRYAKMRKCSSIMLNVWSCNGDALRFCEKLGLKTQKVSMEMLLNEE